MTRVSPRGAIGALSVLTLLLLSATPTVALEPIRCVLRVEPTAAAAGSNFVLSGRGYLPTALELRKRDGRPVRLPLDLPAGESFEIPISSQPGDEGTWTATVFDEAADCEAEVRFRVTLQDTAAGPGAVTADGPLGASLPPVMYLLVVAAGLAGGARLARHARSG